MVLHHLYGQQQLQDCLALLATDDTLLVMNAELLDSNRRPGEPAVLSDAPRRFWT